MKLNPLVIALFALWVLTASNCSSSSDDAPNPEPDTETVNPDPEPDLDPEEEESSNDDYSKIPVPADPGVGKVWEFQSFSDDFEYEAPADAKGDAFFANWDDFYHNAWTGPGLTEWRRDFPFVSDGLLQIPAKRKAGSDKINTGCITHKTRVQYPVYAEARAKIMNSVLANGIWMLSPDDTQEIDMMEAYGADYSESAQASHTWFAERMHISHHVFIRDPFQDYQPKDAGSWYTDGTTKWREDFHTYGVYWRDPWHLEYYIDGELVRTVSGKDMIDPLFYTNETNPGDSSTDTRTGLSKEMDIIIDVEDQDWRSSPASGLQSDTYTPTDSELADEDGHTLKVDWIRIFKPVEQ
ncbi:family 16 glycosylhydrolase [Croceivirga sp. JEA036]|uniref:family 16 glycosylhydrolase n=1 Tax=Croceivirga sp. JEA036 TaxID=2721162 RepID=UPI0014398C5E|nr:family 16 glycosylhydrolase [Croceivirga sp. JEA036]NJB35241.1 family 16 glycosylhydrolase [Croceivirga sp. JEA036]